MQKYSAVSCIPDRGLKNLQHHMSQAKQQYQSHDHERQQRLNENRLGHADRLVYTTGVLCD